MSCCDITTRSTMARSFGKDKEEKEEKESNNSSSTNSSDSDIQGAHGWSGSSGCSDEADSTEMTRASQYHTESLREDAAEGQHLLLDFVRTEMMRNGMETELPCLANEQPAEDTIDPQRLMDWTRAGRELRQLADAFSRSKERQTVQKRAQALSLDSLDFDNFFQLLQELFQGGGITRERILVLFFFCADVAIEALRRGFHQTFHQLLSWSLRYIGTSVAQYVHSVGGWGVVLRQSLDIAYQVSACCAFVAVVAACVVFIRRNLN